jgi:hypothetical protein
VKQDLAGMAAAVGMVVAGRALEAWFENPEVKLSTWLKRAFQTFGELSSESPTRTRTAGVRDRP